MEEGGVKTNLINEVSLCPPSTTPPLFCALFCTIAQAVKVAVPCEEVPVTKATAPS